MERDHLHPSGCRCPALQQAAPPPAPTAALGRGGAAKALLRQRPAPCTPKHSPHPASRPSCVHQERRGKAHNQPGDNVPETLEMAALEGPAQPLRGSASCPQQHKGAPQPAGERLGRGPSRFWDASSLFHRGRARTDRGAANPSQHTCCAEGDPRTARGWRQQPSARVRSSPEEPTPAPPASPSAGATAAARPGSDTARRGGGERPAHRGSSPAPGEGRARCGERGRAGNAAPPRGGKNGLEKG